MTKTRPSPDVQFHDRRFQSVGSQVQQLAAHLGCGAHQGTAGGECGGGTGGNGRFRRGGRVTKYRDDVLSVDAKDFGSHLGQNGGGALAHVHQPAEQGDFSRLGNVDRGGGSGTGAAPVDHHAHALAPTPGRVGRLLQKFVPAESGGAPGQALLQAVTGEGDAALNGLAVNNLVERRQARSGLTFRRHPVLQAKRERVHAKFLGNSVHQRLQGKVTLGRPQRPVRTG